MQTVQRRSLSGVKDAVTSMTPPPKTKPGKDDHIHSSLRHLAVPLEKLKSDPHNPRVHDKKNIRAIMDSIRTHGVYQVLVATEDGTVIRGNGTLAAARALGLTSLPVVRQAASRPGAQEALKIADNRTAELASWDHAILGAELFALRDLDWNLPDLGFEIDDLVTPPHGSPTVRDWDCVDVAIEHWQNLTRGKTPRSTD